MKINELIHTKCLEHCLPSVERLVNICSSNYCMLNLDSHNLLLPVNIFMWLEICEFLVYHFWKSWCYLLYFWIPYIVSKRVTLIKTKPLCHIHFDILPFDNLISQIKDKMVHIRHLFHIILFQLYKRNRKTFERGNCHYSISYYEREFNKSQKQKAGNFTLLLKCCILTNKEEICTLTIMP